MANEERLYKELKNDLDRIVGLLFELGERHIRDRGAFLPFGATLMESGQIGLEAATSGEEIESSIEVLPVLHDGLRSRVQEGGVAAIAVCEWVNIRIDGGRQTDAMKVLVEHERGLTVAFYVPCQEQLLNEWQFEAVFVQAAEGEVRPWDMTDTVS
ncbi:MAG: hypothetical protein ND895_25445 [Pyrinomonadaceae bacterium]|nr:hypothetical protein [Pyrinomonadaceae bacterium]